MEETDAENLKLSVFDLNAKLILSDGPNSLETIMQQNTVIKYENVAINMLTITKHFYPDDDIFVDFTLSLSNFHLCKELLC